MIYTGSRHCGAVAFEVEAPKSRFGMLRGEEQLATYTFNTGVAKHHFCRICGIKPFYVPRSNPDGIDVNVNCLDPVPTDLVIESFGGRDWEPTGRPRPTSARS